MPPSPIIFTLGPFTLRWYGVFIVVAALIASMIAASEARRRGEDPDTIWQALPLVLIFGIIGARLGFVLVNLSTFQSDPIRMLYVWEGGLSIQGGFIAGILALLIYVRRAGLSFFRWADIGIVGVPLAQAIGRWGNFFNQEAYGEPCSDPWCIPIGPGRRPGDLGLKQPDGTPYPTDYGASTNYHFAPTFAYEMIWDLATFGLLFWLARTKRFFLREGDLLFAYGIAYSIGRFVIEGIRLDSASAGGQRAPQLFALATIAVCAVLYVYRHRPGSPVPYATTAEDLDAEATGEDEQPEEDWDEQPEDGSEEELVPAPVARMSDQDLAAAEEADLASSEAEADEQRATADHLAADEATADHRDEAHTPERPTEQPAPSSPPTRGTAPAG